MLLEREFGFLTGICAMCIIQLTSLCLEHGGGLPLRLYSLKLRFTASLRVILVCYGRDFYLRQHNL
jgi:hypothetical protein